MATKQEKPLDLDSISAPADISETPDKTTQLETKELDLEERKAYLRRSELNDNKLKLDLKLRKKYANKLFCLIRNWLIAIFLLLLVQGIFGVLGYFTLSDKVLITIIGGTTLNVLGLFAIVANYIFPKSTTDSKLIKNKK